TVLGSSWTVPLSESTTGDALIGLTVDGRPISIGRDQLRAGGFLEQGLPTPGLFRLPEGSTQRLVLDGVTVVVPARDASKILVRKGPTGEFRSVGLPAPLGAPVVAIGGDLLIPGGDGRVYLIDPKTGTSAADPYVPPFDRARPIRWRSPVLLEGNAVAMADSEATIRRLSVDRTGRPR